VIADYTPKKTIKTAATTTDAQKTPMPAINETLLRGSCRWRGNVGNQYLLGFLFEASCENSWSILDAMPGKPHGVEGFDPLKDFGG